MKQWNTYFGQFRSLNWLMIWLLLCSGGLLLLPLEQLGEPLSAWQAQVTLLLWAGMLVALSYFVSQGLLIGWDWLVGRVRNHYQQARLEQMRLQMERQAQGEDPRFADQKLKQADDLHKEKVGQMKFQTKAQQDLHKEKVKQMRLKPAEKPKPKDKR